MAHGETGIEFIGGLIEELVRGGAGTETSSHGVGSGGGVVIFDIVGVEADKYIGGPGGHIGDGIFSTVIVNGRAAQKDLELVGGDGDGL